MMFNLSDMVGMMIKGGMSPSSPNRLNHALGSKGSSGGGLGDLLGSLTGGSADGGGLGDLLGNLVGGGGGSTGGGGGLGGMLGNILGEVTQSLGGKSNLALSGLSSLAGSVLGGGGGGSSKKATGSGAMALLGALAFKALKGSRTASEPTVPLGLREPESAQEEDELENNAGLVLKAMINAAKSDGQIDQQEIQRIVGKLRGEGIDEEAQEFIMTEMKRPLDLEGLCTAAEGQQELAAQMYAASLMAIEVDTPSEQRYMQQLAQGLGLTTGTAQRLQHMVGIQ